jgi:hypothetical protein
MLTILKVLKGTPTIVARLVLSDSTADASLKKAVALETEKLMLPCTYTSPVKVVSVLVADVNVERLVVLVPVVV